MSDIKKIIKNENADNKKNTFSRRDFLKFFGIMNLGLLGMQIPKAATQDYYRFNLNNTDFVSNKEYAKSDIILPDTLKKGDTVAFVAPASPVSKGQITRYVNYFKDKGCNVVIGDTILNQKNDYKYLAASDEIRANELNYYFRDKDVKAIICGRGGYGIIRILDLLDYEALRKYPKIIMGYSDITALLIAVYRRSGIITYHGPVGVSNLTEEHKKNLDQTLFSKEDKIVYSIPDMKTICPGETTGILQGGNLTLITAAMGTKYSMQQNNALLFLEDVSVLAHEFDRMLNQLLIANKLRNCKGIMFGKMSGLNKRGNFYPNKAYTILEVMTEVTKDLNIPVSYDVPFGHVESTVICPIGLNAYLNTEKKYIEISKKLPC